MLAEIVKGALNRRTEAVSAYYSICPRLAAYEHNIAVRDVIVEKGKNMLNLNLGGYVHGVILDQLAKSGCQIEKPIPLDDYGCHGHKFKADAICGDTVVEMKTASTDKYRVFWEWQLKAYMALTGLRKGKLIVIWMPTASVSEYLITIDEEEAEAIKERIRTMCKSLDKKWEDVEPVRGEWCSLCPVRNQCLNGKLM
ncbi:MAG: Dna2/Cas4 domain-containing protein [Thermoproteus sp.]|nr:Dna2/Cas4 domain-containing protein [Thermoproteus sp.]